MKYTRPVLGSLGLIALMLAASAWAWPRLGEQPIAVHFDMAGHPNGFASRPQALLMLPVMGALISLFLAVLPPLMPKRGRLERSWGPYTIAWMGILGVFLVIHLALIAKALGTPLDMGRVAIVSVGALTALIGNFLGKVRYNYVFGIRTPWTLANEQVWDRTHRLVGWLMALGGVAMVLAGLLAPSGYDTLLPLVLIVGAVGPAVTGLIYSILESRRLERGAA